MPEFKNGEDLASHLGSEPISPWLFANAVPDGKTLTILHGPGGCGKSTLARTLALSVISKRTLIPAFTLEEESYGANVALLTAEDSGERVMESMQAIAQQYAIPEGDIDWKKLQVCGEGFHFLDSNLDWSGAFCDMFEPKLYKGAQNFEADLLIIDSMANYFGVHDENSAHHARAFLGAVEYIDAESVLLLHHTATGGDKPRGSSVLWNSARAVWHMEPAGENGAVVTCQKLNQGLRPAPSRLKFESVEIGNDYSSVDYGVLRQTEVDSPGLERFLGDWIAKHPALITIGGVRQGKAKEVKTLLSAIAQEHPDATRKDIASRLTNMLKQGRLSEAEEKGRNGYVRKLLSCTAQPAQ